MLVRINLVRRTQNSMLNGKRYAEKLGKWWTWNPSIAYQNLPTPSSMWRDYTESFDIKLENGNLKVSYGKWTKMESTLDVQRTNASNSLCSIVQFVTTTTTKMCFPFIIAPKCSCDRPRPLTMMKSEGERRVKTVSSHSQSIDFNSDFICIIRVLFYGNEAKIPLSRHRPKWHPFLTTPNLFHSIEMRYFICGRNKWIFHFCLRLSAHRRFHRIFIIFFAFCFKIVCICSK